ncbi:hypothetical protein ABZ092_39140 [Streptomyces bobili]|uniref:hypothetical protein n=1 Tax=Streptomyces bobili TaxID=67280 RepID=UPI0033BEC41F
MSTWDPVALEALIEEATVDAYGEDEQLTGFFTMIEESLAVPFSTTVLGVDASVVGVDPAEDGRVVARCARGPVRQHIGIWTCRCRNLPPRAGNGSRHTATGPAELARRTTARVSSSSNVQSPRLRLTGPTAGNRQHVTRIPQYACGYG